MKHRALSMLLALVMVVSLLPIAAIANGAEENTAAEERKETVEMRENDSQQGGDGEKSQLPTEENEKTFSSMSRKKVARPLTHGISMMRMFACRGWFM